MNANQKILTEAFKLVGLKEYPGLSNNNYYIVNMIKGLIPWAEVDEIAWCGAAMHYIANKVNANIPDGIPYQLARKWLEVGEIIEEPKPGDLVVFWRESLNSWKGHVGVFINEMNDAIWVLGGNQNNQYNLKPYPRRRLLGYRRLHIEEPENSNNNETENL